MKDNYSFLHKALIIEKFENPLILSAPNGFCLDQKSFINNKKVVSILVIDCFIISSNGRNKKILRKPISAIISTTIVEFKKEDTSDKDIFLELKDVEKFIKALNILKVDNVIIKDYEIEDNLVFAYIYKKNDKSVTGKKDHTLNVFFVLNNKLISLAMINYSEKYNSKSLSKKLLVEYVNNIKLSNKIN